MFKDRSDNRLVKKCEFNDKYLMQSSMKFKVKQLICHVKEFVWSVLEQLF